MQLATEGEVPRLELLDVERGVVGESHQCEVAGLIAKGECGPAGAAAELGGSLLAAAPAAMALHGLDSERGAAAAGTLDVGIAQVEACAHEIVGVVQLGPVQVEIALPVDDHAGTVALEEPVPVAPLVEVHLVGEARAASADDLDPQTALVRLFGRNERANLGDRSVAEGDSGWA